MSMRRLQKSGVLPIYILLLLITLLGSYLILRSPTAGKSSRLPADISYDAIEKEIVEDTKHRIFDVTYAPVFYPKYYEKYHGSKNEEKEAPSKESNNKYKEIKEHGNMINSYHSLWTQANHFITKDQLFPYDEDVERVLNALKTAKIVYVELMDTTDYESGTSEKWIIALEGGQKAVVKLIWGNKGAMKEGGLCNYGFEMPWSEIAAFNLHRVLDFRNTPYVVGRKIDVMKEIIPVATPEVLKHITIGEGNEVCIHGKCYFCKREHKLCPQDGIVEASVAYWVPRHLHLYTWYPDYMPFSTPRMHNWGKIGFNNKTFCNEIRKEKPYDQLPYYLDLFDFAVIDTLMYHFDSKHYVVEDDTSSHGLTVRLDHGRAFCDFVKDDLDIFLAPITQCCTLRRSSYEKLKIFQKGSLLTRRLASLNNKDSLAPLLDKRWYPALERRLKFIFDAIKRCAKANGGLDKILV